MKALLVDNFESGEAFRLADITDPTIDDNVEIQVHAAGLGYPDALIARGQYQVRPSLPFVPGMEVSGVVLAAPAGSDYLVGSSVVALTGFTGGCAELAVVRPEFVYPAPVDVAAWLTGALVVNYHTAYFALVRRGNLQPGQTVLVHGAGGGLGQATIQVAKALDAQVLAIASTAEKQEAAAAAGADHVLAGDDTWTARVRDLTRGEGVALVIDPVGGNRFVESLRLLSTEGRVVVVGFASGEIPQAKTNRLLMQNTSVVGAAWREFVEREPGYGQLIASELNMMFNSGRIHAPRTTSVLLDQSPDAMRDIMDNRLIGRLSVRMPCSTP